MIRTNLFRNITLVKPLSIEIRIIKNQSYFQSHKAVKTRLNHTQPSKLGYCLDASSGNRPEYCRCSKNSEGTDSCAQRCEMDPECRAYSYRYPHSSCYLYTTSNCTDNCYKRNVGNVGKIVETKDNVESGCFMMSRSTFYQLLTSKF